MDITDIQFFLSVGLAFVFGGIVVFLFGMDKGGYFDVKLAWVYVLTGAVALLFGTGIMIWFYHQAKKLSRSA